MTGWFRLCYTTGDVTGHVSGLLQWLKCDGMQANGDLPVRLTIGK